eukprot:scaffold10679_cov99-Skeletonema_dohrnii-CCMP3373.AAC.8
MEVPEEQTILNLATIPFQKVTNLEPADTAGSYNFDNSFILHVRWFRYFDRLDMRNGNDDPALLKAHNLSMP